jgi:putative flavoprotein involved in K+ transport
VRSTTVIIGAGQAGLAMSRCLAERSIDHVILERGEVAHSWKTERWDSLRLLTPNWQSRLPGFGYEGDDPDGYRTMPETIAFIERYADVISAPVQSHTTVTSVRASNGGYHVATDQGTSSRTAGSWWWAHRPRARKSQPRSSARAAPSPSR